MVRSLRARLLPFGAALALICGILGAMAGVASTAASALSPTQTVIISAQPSFGAAPGDDVSLQAQVSVQGGGPTPTGSVTFFAVVKGQPAVQNLGNSPLDANGIAPLDIAPNTLAPAEYHLIGVYSGDVNDAPSTGSTPYEILATCSTSQFPPETQGVPFVQPGSPLGYYIGQSNGAWSVFTAKPDNGGTTAVHFTGTIHTDGRFVNVTSVRNEKSDRVTMSGAHEIKFKFTTHLSIDWLSFFPVCGSEVTFNLSVNGAPASTSEIFLGNPTTSNPTSNPFTETR